MKYHMQLNHEELNQAVKMWIEKKTGLKVANSDTIKFSNTVGMYYCMISCDQGRAPGDDFDLSTDD